jgi:hypothetical protein
MPLETEIEDRVVLYITYAVVLEGRFEPSLSIRFNQVASPRRLVFCVVYGREYPTQLKLLNLHV